MKKQKCILALLLAINAAGCSFLSDSVPEMISVTTDVQTEIISTVAETQKATFPHKETESEPVTELQNQTVQALYDQLYTEVSQYHEIVSFDYKINPDELAEAMNILERKHPEIFWINGYSLCYNDTSAEVTFKIINQYTPDELRIMSDELNITIQQILRNLDVGLSDYDILLQIHDYLVIHTEYDSDSALLSEKGIWSSAYGCLINGKAVCQGYAQAFQLLANASGIECGICSGIAKNEPHAWNYVLLNQHYYWVDVTWDDPVSTETTESNDWIHHGYFLINDEMLYRSRTLDGKELLQPVCNTIEDNYFVKQENYLSEYQFAEIDKRLSEHVSDGKIEIMFATQEAYQACIQDLFTENKIWNAEIFQETGGSVNYQQDPNLYILRFLFETNPSS